MIIENFVGAAESEILEWKPSLSQLNRIIETISAFSNTKGGIIIIGVDGTGKILGISIGKDTIEQLTNKIISNTEPKIYPDISLYLDSQICKEATFDDIDNIKVKKFLERASFERRLEINPNIIPEEALRKLNLRPLSP